jgi:low molecular weight phosphotyrosine protein phosphatase
MGEAVLAHIAAERGLDQSRILVDSAGTGSWHIGEDPDDRTVATCKKYKVAISHAARQVTGVDFSKFTHILAADTNNLRDLERIRPAGSKAELKLWGSYAEGQPIPDPYYGGNSGFETCYEMCTKLSNAFLDAVLD